MFIEVTPGNIVNISCHDRIYLEGTDVKSSRSVPSGPPIVFLLYRGLNQHEIFDAIGSAMQRNDSYLNLADSD